MEPQRSELRRVASLQRSLCPAWLSSALLLLCACGPSRLRHPRRAQDAAVESPAHISVVDGAALLERDGRSESAPGVDAAARRRSRAHAERPRRGALRRRQHAPSRREYPRGLSIRRGDPAARRPRPPQHRRRRRREPDVAYRVDAPSAWVQIARPGEYRISVLGRGDDARDRSRARRAARRGRPRQRGRPHDARRRRARVCPRGRGAVVVVRVQLGVVGHLRSLVRRPARLAPRRVGGVSPRNGADLRLDVQ